MHLSPQPEIVSPRPHQRTLRFQRNANGAARIQNNCAQKTRSRGHVGRPRCQRLVPRPHPSPLLVLPRLHFRDTWRTHRQHCSMVSNKGRTPMSSSTDLAIATARDLIAALWSSHPASPISPLSDRQVSALKNMAEIFKTTFEEARDHKDNEPLLEMPPMALPGDNQPEKKLPVAEPRALKLLSQPHPALEPRVETPPKTSPKLMYTAATRNRNATRRQNMKLTAPIPNKNMQNSQNW